MSNLIPFGQGQVPAHILAAQSAGDSNIAPKSSIPALSFRGKAWRIMDEGNETLITGKDGDPSPTVSLIVLDYIKKNSRAFYEGQYVNGENKAPTCSSMDGISPDKGIANPVASKCASCPNAVKGSKISPNGVATTLCTSNKRIAVIPATKTDFKALLLRLPPTSIWDKTTANDEWKTWEQFLDHIRASGVTNTAFVVAKVKFDHRVEYPKLLFKADRWATPEEIAAVGDRWKSDEVKNLLMGNQADDVDTDDGYDAPAQPAPALAQPAPTEAPAAAPAPTRTRKPKETAPAPQPVAQPAPAVDDEDDGSWGEVPTAAAQPAPAPQPTPTPTAAPVQPAAAPATNNAGLSSLLGAWDDE